MRLAEGRNHTNEFGIPRTGAAISNIGGDRNCIFRILLHRARAQTREQANTAAESPAVPRRTADDLALEHSTGM